MLIAMVVVLYLGTKMSCCGLLTLKKEPGKDLLASIVPPSYILFSSCALMLITMCLQE